MEKYYRFAGVELAVSAADDLIFTDDRALAPFAVDSVSVPHRFAFHLVEHLPPPSGECVAKMAGFRVYSEGARSMRYVGAVSDSWEGAYMRIDSVGHTHTVRIKSSMIGGRLGVHTVLSAIEPERLVLGADGVILHASFIIHNGRAILFTAPSQTGKSTQAELWRKLRGAAIANGDRAVIRLRADGEGAGIYAEGLPYAGSSVYCENRSVPLAAIVYLGQAKTTELVRVKGFEAFRCVWEGCSVNTWSRADMERATELVEQIVTDIPICRLNCTPDESAVRALEQMLEEGRA